MKALSKEWLGEAIRLLEGCISSPCGDGVGTKRCLNALMQDVLYKLEAINRQEVITINCEMCEHHDSRECLKGMETITSPKQGYCYHNRCEGCEQDGSDGSQV